MAATTKTLLPGQRYGYGKVAEMRLINDLEAEGYLCTRGAGSKGIDVIATRHDKILFCSVKRTATWRRAGTVYRAERKQVLAWELPSTPKVQRLLALWSDELAPDTPGRGGFWYCLEIVEAPKIPKEVAA